MRIVIAENADLAGILGEAGHEVQQSARVGEIIQLLRGDEPPKAFVADGLDQGLSALNWKNGVPGGLPKTQIVVLSRDGRGQQEVEQLGGIFADISSDLHTGLLRVLQQIKT